MNYRTVTQRLFAPVLMNRKSASLFSLLEISISLLSIALVYSAQYATSAIEHNNIEQFHLRIIIAALVGFMLFIVNSCLKPRAFKYFSDMRINVDKIIMPKIIAGNNNAYEKIGTGRLINIYSKGLYARSTIAAELMSSLFGSLLFFIIFLITIYQKDIILFIVGISVLIVCVVRFCAIGHLQFQRRKKSKEVTIEVNKTRTRWFMSKFEIMQQGKIYDEIDHNNIQHHLRYQYKKQEKIYQGYTFDGMIFLSTLMYVGLLYYTGKSVLIGSMTYADLVVIVGLGSMFVRDLEHIMRTIRMSIIDKRVHVEKLRDMVDQLNHNAPRIDQGVSFQHISGSIHLQGIVFSYNNTHSILSNLSLTIPGGSKTALVGPSGGGKSTIIKLVAGYLRPDSGSVTVDDQDITDVSLKSYYKHIGYLTQEPSVFDGTIWENLTYAMEETCHSALDAESSISHKDPGSSQGGHKEELQSMDTEVMEKVKQAISDAQCEFIWDLPNGVDTEIGERGVRLSGGQRQRLAIAKIFLKNPEIVLLDEPTSALDSESEEKVTIAMNRLFENRTVIVIAHRLQTVKHADQILYIEAGEVVESGTHEELMSQEGKYYKMVELQSGF